MANLNEPLRGHPRPIFVDASAWVARFKRDDRDHQRAVDIFRGQIPDDIPLITSNVVLYEVLTVLSMKAGKEHALQFGHWFYEKAVKRGMITQVFVDEAVEQKAWQLFQSVANKNVSFVDCTSVVLAADWDASEIVTFDKHFSQLIKSLDVKILK